MEPVILAIDTSCDETSVSVTQGRRVLSNVIFSQVTVHAPFGGVYPSLAKREHASKIDSAIALALKRGHKIPHAIAVTFGPGLPPALEVGVQTAKDYAKKLSLPLIPVDHIEGHIYSAYAQNSNGKPLREITYPFLSFIVSGGHTSLVLVTSPLSYTILGETLDDAAGEALDKGARLLHLGYPGGAALERVALKGSPTIPFPLPLQGKKTLSFSFSGIKTALRREVERMPSEKMVRMIPDIAASYQHVIITSLIQTLNRALKEYPVAVCTLGGGVSANKTFLRRFREITRANGVKGITPPFRYLHTDNAAMIGVVASLKWHEGIYLTDPDILDRSPQARLTQYVALDPLQ